MAVVGLTSTARNFNTELVKSSEPGAASLISQFCANTPKHAPLGPLRTMATCLFWSASWSVYQLTSCGKRLISISVSAGSVL